MYGIIEISKSSYTGYLQLFILISWDLTRKLISEVGLTTIGYIIYLVNIINYNIINIFIIFCVIISIMGGLSIILESGKLGQKILDNTQK